MRDTSVPSPEPPRARRVDPAGLVVAALLLALAAIIAWDLSGQTLSSTYGLGPTAMPGVVAAGLAALGVANGVGALRGTMPDREGADLRPVLTILAGLAALIGLMAVGGGFIVGTAILFAATARAFGRRATGADLAIGLALAVAIYLLFAKLLTLSLPTGPLERLF